MFTIQYIAHYSASVRIQSFSTLEAAQKMIAFMASCGTTARLI